MPRMRLPPAKALVIALLPLLPAACLLMQARPAAAQIESREGIALRDQILELRQEVDALRAQVANGGGSYLGGAAPAQAAPAAGTSDMVAHLLDRMNGLEDEIRNLRGRIDELQNDDAQKIADLGKRIDDLKFEVENPGAGGPAPSQTGPSAGTLRAPPAPPSAPPPARRPEADRNAPRPLAPVPSDHRPTGPLQAAYAALDHRDYPAAERSARSVLARRAAPGAYDAQFVLAEALAGQHQWSRAAIAYDDAYNRSKNGTHAPAALLGLAESLSAINERRAACETLAKLHAQYPRQGTALKSQAIAVARRAGCR
jgi:TolA-binding protein